MEVLIINQSEVRQLLPMHECVGVMESALIALAQGEAIVPLRPVLWLPEKYGALGMMPGYLGDINMMGIKVVTVMPGNHGTEYDSHQGTVMIFEAKHGQLLSIMDASEITAIRTAGVSGVATRLLARKDARVVAILGSGVQAHSHLQAMLTVRDVELVRVWSRTSAHAKKFVERHSDNYDVRIEAIESVKEAVRDADIICTTTSAREPIVDGEWLTPGTHINAVGSSVNFTRELTTSAIVRSRLFIDRRESTLNEAGDFLIPKAEGAIDDSHIVGELGEILTGQIGGRNSDEEITLFKSLGLAIEDIASAHHVYQKAREYGLGTSVELGGERNV